MGEQPLTTVMAEQKWGQLGKLNGHMGTMGSGIERRRHDSQFSHGLRLLMFALGEGRGSKGITLHWLLRPFIPQYSIHAFALWLDSHIPYPFFFSLSSFFSFPFFYFHGKYHHETWLVKASECRSWGIGVLNGYIWMVWLIEFFCIGGWFALIICVIFII